MMCRLALLPACILFVLGLAMPGAVGKGLPSLDRPAQYGLDHLDVAIVAPERAAAPRGQGDGRDDAPGDGLTARQAASREEGPWAMPAMRGEPPPPLTSPRTALARAPPRLFA